MFYCDIDGRKKPCVYRYIDMQDGEIKYIGIVHNSTLIKRLRAHASNDGWCKNRYWKIQYFECENRSEAEAFESHLIELYGTWRYYNKAKKHWGINKYLPNVENLWKDATSGIFQDYDTFIVWLAFKKALSKNDMEIAQMFYSFFDFEG